MKPQDLCSLLSSQRCLFKTHTHTCVAAGPVASLCNKWNLSKLSSTEQIFSLFMHEFSVECHHLSVTRSMTMWGMYSLHPLTPPPPLVSSRTPGWYRQPGPTQSLLSSSGSQLHQCSAVQCSAAPAAPQGPQLQTLRVNFHQLHNFHARCVTSRTVGEEISERNKSVMYKKKSWFVYQQKMFFLSP